MPVNFTKVQILGSLENLTLGNPGTCADDTSQLELVAAALCGQAPVDRSAASQSPTKVTSLPCFLLRNLVFKKNALIVQILGFSFYSAT